MWTAVALTEFILVIQTQQTPSGHILHWALQSQGELRHAL